MSTAGRKLRLGLPKGSLQETTRRLFTQAGYQIRIAERSYYPDIDDPELECILIRAQEMARYVGQGVLDAGITGIDWTTESRARVKELADLRAPWPNYGPVRWVVAVKEGSKIRKPADLAGKRIATEVVNLTRRYLRRQGVRAEVEFSWGATEVKPPILADAIVDVTETGSSLRANNLRVIDTVIESTPRFIANPESVKDAWKLRKMERMLLMLKGAIEAIDRVGLMLNVPKQQLDAVLSVLPALGTPTISTLSDECWVAINTVIEEHLATTLYPKLVEVGARAIVEYPLNKIVG
ncbi:MAG: ATP phosphoribosyltransferase [Myxococcota bacterium]|jgi:ATP phosphoribosyltransferase|nr:ATP phosphoribosyltransferase [Deltaproteobacteria bacterium]MCP4241460.1 ATP phosphoribosyltransferase [bacterium]MDP6074032.1 ATP phosphoribosyltransferase [Myxococcota bacterium]MDP6242680.1 ATP phosphoribosyltransferase [Myxococcota bacterium]MDP7073447.1 ATP phosphoribosyltransferase [Myxococcota bacterium]